MRLCLSTEGHEHQVNCSYTSFGELRKLVAFSLGFDLDTMQGYRKKHQNDEGFIKIGYRSWGDIKSPLKKFLNHPHDIGIWTPQMCMETAPILKMVAFLWEESFVGHLRKLAFELVALMEYAAANDKRIHFG